MSHRSEETRLLALVLARSLNVELPNTRQNCLNDISSSVLANELAETAMLLENAVTEVNTLRGYLRPINRLPPELLVHIFSFLGGGTFVVPASQVCRRWRDVALDTFSLWTVIREEDSVSAAERFMERSRHAKLDVSFIIDMHAPDDFVILRNLVIPHATRIRRLHLDVYGDRAYDFYRMLADRDFLLPGLEHFSIQMNQSGWHDDTHYGPLPSRESFFGESEFFERLTFRAVLPLPTHFSGTIKSLTLADRVFDLDALLECLDAAPNLEYLALLNSVPHTFESAARGFVVSLNRLRELNWFQALVCDNVLGTVKLFEHLDMPNLDTAAFVLLLNPSKYSPSQLYTPCSHSVTLFGTTSTITELLLEASHFTPEKPARDDIVFHGRRHNPHETLFSVRVSRCTLESFGNSERISITSSVHVNLTHLTHLTFTSKFPYDWNRFFRKSWSHFLRSVPSVKVLRLYVSNPIDILTAISDPEELCATSPTTSSTPILPNLQAIHLFRCSISRTGSPHDGGNNHAAAGTDTVGSIFEREDDEQNLVHFLQHRADLGIPIKTIVCTAEDAEAIALDQPEVLSLVDTVESGLLPEEIWGKSLFPNRLIPLLEENLD
ncbi:hypothetical protein F5888DRAFT_802940 [Russula emetica]|nr:hypothetical protein F5888DRAFT_802940 [Russula emetica]